MKKLFVLLLALCAAFSLAGCSGNPVPAKDGVDVDLTPLSSTMVYSEVYNMLCAPEDYLGKTVRLSGTFDVYHDDSTGNNYFLCLVTDTTACCQQGLEFILRGDAAYPADYPAVGETVTVKGEFQTYTEGEYMYCHLVGAELG